MTQLVFLVLAACATVLFVAVLLSLPFISPRCEVSSPKGERIAGVVLIAGCP